jgi:hypothetical protein
MRSNLFSLHPIICDIVENGMHVLGNDDEIHNAMYFQEMFHKNTQATTMLLASLCREEYNEVSGLNNAK